jgi:ParB-like chromosome segregation protein Spo0J
MAAKEYRIHPTCLLFPEMTKAELQALADDIQLRGLLQSIVLYEGKILDGRNRYKACKIAGVKPSFVQWDGDGDPLAWVISTNLVRRHLTASQRAILALDVLPLLAKQAKERQRLGRGKKVAQIRAEETGKASSAAAKIVQSSSTYVEMAKAVHVTAPDLIAEIRSGQITVPEAKALADMLPDQRRLALRQLRQGNLSNGKGKPFVFGTPRKSKPTEIQTPPGICQFLHDLISPVYPVKTILDPSAGDGALTKPWKNRKAISFEINNGKDFLQSPEWIEVDLVLCNPPFNDRTGTRHLPQLFLQRIVQVVPAGTPIAFFAPLTLRIDQGCNSARWRWLRDCCPPITSIISLPYDVFAGAKVHAEIIIFNMPTLKPHYFLPDEYLA